MILKKKWTPGAHVPPPRGNIHVYYHNIQTSSPLKPLGDLWQGQHGLPMHLNGKTVKMSFEGKSQQEIGKWTEY